MTTCEDQLEVALEFDQLTVVPDDLPRPLVYLGILRELIGPRVFSSLDLHHRQRDSSQVPADPMRASAPVLEF